MTVHGHRLAVNRRAAWSSVVLAALALAAGCGGGGGNTQASAPETAVPAPTAPAPAPAPEVTVRVRNGDTGQLLAGVAVSAKVPGGDPAIMRTDATGTVAVPAGATLVTAAKPGWPSAQERVDGRPVVRVDLYDPALQSPEYGGGPTRDRYVPAVKAGPPKGKPTWMFDAITLIEFPPAVVDGQVVFGVNSGRVFALDADTGKVLWEDRVKGAIASAPAIADGTAYITSMDGMLTAYRLADGKRLWQYSTGGSPIESSPLVHAGKVYFGAWNGTVYAVDARRPKLVWSRSMSAEIKGSVALAGERILVGDYSGRVSAFGAASGEERWTYRGGQRFYGGPGVSGNLAVIGDVGGAVIALDVRTGAERWRHTTGDWVYGSPAIADGRVFIGSYDGNFQALDLATGAVRWTHAAGGRISGSATVIDGIVYTSILYREGQPRKTWGLDVRTGAVRWQNDDGRYSPAVGAGSTVYIVGTKLLRAYRSKTPAAP